MSRSGYSEDDYDQWSMIRWRGAVNAAINGKRGQAFLKEMLTALDALPRKQLVTDELATHDVITCSHWGLYEIESVCALGAIGKTRGLDMTGLDPDDSATVAGTFGIADAMAREIVSVNDDDLYYTNNETPERRFERVRNWVAGQIKPEKEDQQTSRE